MLKPETKKTIIRGVIATSIIIVICVAFFLLFYLTGWYKYFDSTEKIEAIINSGGGVWSRTIFFAIQFIQVTFIPAPAMLTTIAGVFLFGPWQTVLLSIPAVVLGSMFAFFLGRKIGSPIINWVAGGKEEANKWKTMLSKGKYMFFLMMLFPLFPDDILCMVAGVTNMSWTFFIVTNIITRTINNFVMCFLTSGSIIPFSGWGIPVWIVLGIIMIILFVLSIKYQKNIELFLTNIANKMSKKHKNKKPKLQKSEAIKSAEEKYNTNNNDDITKNSTLIKQNEIDENDTHKYDK